MQRRQRTCHARRLVLLNQHLGVTSQLQTHIHLQQRVAARIVVDRGNQEEEGNEQSIYKSSPQRPHAARVQHRQHHLHASLGILRPHARQTHYASRHSPTATRRNGVDSWRDDENEAQLLVRQDGVEEDEGDDGVEQRRQHGVQVEHAAQHPHDVAEIALILGVVLHLIRHLPEVLYASVRNPVRTESLEGIDEEGGECGVQRERNKHQRVVE